MTRYLDLTAKLAARIAAGELPAGSALASVRELAAQEGTTASTVGRAYRELAEAGAIELAPRRAGRVAAHGPLMARSLLRGRAPFRLAGSDDPALSLLMAAVPDAVASVGAAGSYRGLTALWAGRAEGAPPHPPHRSGEDNAPFARAGPPGRGPLPLHPWRRRQGPRRRAVLAGRDPVLVHLWRREQGLIVPAGNPQRIERVADLAAVRVARRPTGTGTRTLLDRLLLDARLDPAAIAGPVVELHLDVALAVATGEADAGLGLRSAATPLELGFVPVVWEPFQIATTRTQSGGVRPLLEALAGGDAAGRILALGGYDLEGAGEVLELG